MSLTQSKQAQKKYDAAQCPILRSREEPLASWNTQLQHEISIFKIYKNCRNHRKSQKTHQMTTQTDMSHLVYKPTPALYLSYIYLSYPHTPLTAMHLTSQ